MNRINENGVIQTEHDSAQTRKSVNYTRTAAQVEKDLGISLKNPFSSVALPNTKAGGNQLNEPLPKGDSGSSEDYDNYRRKGELTEGDSDMPANSPGKAVYTGNNSGIKVGADGLPVNNPNRFLSYDGPGGALGALRHKEAQSGIVYAAGGDRGGVSGNNWINHDGELYAISDEDKRTYQAGGKGAQALLDTWKSNITAGKSRAASTIKPSTPAVEQAPTTATQSKPTAEAVGRTFNPNMQLYPGIPPTMPENNTVDFNINNYLDPNMSAFGKSIEIGQQYEIDYEKLWNGEAIWKR